MVIEKIFEQARCKPDKPAIYYQGYTISYGQFAFWIWHARQYLDQQHLRRGSVAVLLGVPCRLDAWVFDFALRSLGMDTIAVRFLDEFEQVRVRNIGCVITTIQDRPIRIAQESAGCKVIRIPHPLYLGKAAGNCPEPPQMLHPAGGHILLTSGTTGERKKVLIDAGSLSNRIARHCDIYSISEYSTANVFNFAMWTGAGYKLPLCAWSMGGSVIFHQDPEPHRSLLIDGITHAVFTPATLSALLKAPAVELRRNPDMRIFVAGAPLTRTLAAVTEERLTPQISTFVASTEAGMWALTRIERPEDLHAHTIHPSIEVQVVDQADQPVASGQLGAIRVRAVDGVTSYLDDDSASRAIFRHGYFYPGDLGHFQEDGRLVLHGRMANVLNLAGNKIAVEPVEQLLQERLGAEGVCVIGLRAESGDDELHVVIQSYRPIGRAEVAELMGARLPHFSPGQIHFVEAIPLNELGKIDRNRLRQQISATRAGMEV